MPMEHHIFDCCGIKMQFIPENAFQGLEVRLVIRDIRVLHVETPTARD